MLSSVLLLVGSSRLPAYELDLHYHVKFKVAVADSWSWEEAHAIASADQGVDENKETVAALEVRPSGGVDQSPKNYRYHCFSEDADQAASQKDQRNQDVLDNLDDLEEQTNDAIEAAKASGASDDATRALIAIGVYLHCQEDSWSHSGFGGENDGHALETARDTIASRTNPDHPAVRPTKTRKALDETLEKLSDFMELWKDQETDITKQDLQRLKSALTHPSGKRLNDDLRRSCNQDLAEHWLYLTLEEKKKLDKAPDESIQNFEPSTERSIPFGPNCKDIHDAVFPGDHTEKKVVDPEPEFPKLRLDGTPERVDPNGNYEPVSAATFDYSVEEAFVRHTPTPFAGYDPELGDARACTFTVTASVANRGPGAGPPARLSTVIARETGLPFGQDLPIDPMPADTVTQVEGSFFGPCAAEYALVADVQPAADFPLDDQHWDDADVGNDVVHEPVALGGILELFGISEGGIVELRIQDVVVTVPTQTGESAAQIVRALADAINRNDELGALGIFATVRANSLKIFGGTLDGRTTSDGGLSFDSPGLPSCVTGVTPAATLLLPFFQVDLADPGGLTTLLAVNNYSEEPQIAHVVLWTDLAVPTLAFDVYLTGYDVQTLNLRDVLRGRLPATGPAISNLGGLSTSNGAFPGCPEGDVGPGTLEPSRVSALQADHTGRPNPLHGTCAGTDHGDAIARGYVTIDVAHRCSSLDPSDPEYFATGSQRVAAERNVLTGDYFFVTPSENFAQGSELVHVPADEQRFEPGEHTFYGRFVDFQATDHRAPLSGVYGTRFLQGGAFNGGTSLIVWRDPPVATTDRVPCGTLPLWTPLTTSLLLAFDEEENVSQVSPTATFPIATQMVPVGGPDLPIAPSFGWLYLDLWRSGEVPAQAWVTPVLRAEGRYSLGLNATRIDDGCDFPPRPLAPVP